MAAVSDVVAVAGRVSIVCTPTIRMVGIQNGRMHAHVTPGPIRYYVGRVRVPRFVANRAVRRHGITEVN